MDRLIDKTPDTTEILIFKTSLQTRAEVQFISGILDTTEGIKELSVDLDDWESILRIQSIGITAKEIIKILNQFGINSKELEM